MRQLEGAEAATSFATGMAAISNTLFTLLSPGDRVVSVDVFDAPDTCRKVWSRLLSGVILDAVEDQPAPGNPDVGAALSSFGGAWQSVPAAGAGEEYRSVASGQAWHGSVLAQDGRVIHGSLVLAG